MYSAQWKSPSNIALIKYWGKYGNQLPRNPSVSFTLDSASTTTRVTLTEKNDKNGAHVDFLFEGQKNDAFASRIEKFLNSISNPYFPFIQDYRLRIESSNTFPHSSGIASSASGMSALALCLSDIQNQLTGTEDFSEAFYRHASVIARLGSGSASRSVFPFMAVWGTHPDIYESSDAYAIGIEEKIDPVFKTFHDDILIISPKEKSVSSTAGHQLMEGNPFAAPRYEQARQRMSALMVALSAGDIETFGRISEDEALTLHALMMCSDPSYILMEEGSLSVIKAIRQFRQDTKVPVYFTLDAGPNVHVLYPGEFSQQVDHFINSELKPYCHNGRIIHDKAGQGPQKIV